MGTPTSDDDPTRRVPGHSASGQGEGGRDGGPRAGSSAAPGHGGVQYPAPGRPGGPGPAASYPPPPGEGGAPAPDQPTTRLPQAADREREQTAHFPSAGGHPPGGPAGPGSAPGGPGYLPVGPGAAPGTPGHLPGGPGGGPSGPYPWQGGSYGGPSPEARRSNRGLVIALVVGLVILAGLVVALIIAYTRDGGDTVAAGPPTATSAAPWTPSSGTNATGTAVSDELLRSGNDSQR